MGSDNTSFVQLYTMSCSYIQCYNVNGVEIVRFGKKQRTSRKLSRRDIIAIVIPIVAALVTSGTLIFVNVWDNVQTDNGSTVSQSAEGNGNIQVANVGPGANVSISNTEPEDSELRIIPNSKLIYPLKIHLGVGGASSAFSKYEQDVIESYGSLLYGQISSSKPLKTFWRKAYLLVGSNGRLISGYIDNYDGPPPYNIEEADNMLLQKMKTWVFDLHNNNYDTSLEQIYYIERDPNGMAVDECNWENGLRITGYELNYFTGSDEGRCFILSNPTKQLMVIQQMRVVIDNIYEVPPHECGPTALFDEIEYELEISPTKTVYDFAINEIKLLPLDADRISVVMRAAEMCHEYNLHFEIEWYFVRNVQVHTLITRPDKIFFFCCR
jgi:hypothetical protein